MNWMKPGENRSATSSIQNSRNSNLHFWSIAPLESTREYLNLPPFICFTLLDSWRNGLQPALQALHLQRALQLENLCDKTCIFASTLDSYEARTCNLELWIFSLMVNVPKVVIQDRLKALFFLPLLLLPFSPALLPVLPSSFPFLPRGAGKPML